MPRGNEVCKCSGFRTVQHHDITKQYKNVIFALDEERKFIEHTAGHKWPVDLEFSRQNVPPSTVLDSDINSNMVNEHEMLPTLLELLQQFDPHLSETLRKSIKVEKEANISTE